MMGILYSTCYTTYLRHVLCLVPSPHSFRTSTILKPYRTSKINLPLPWPYYCRCSESILRPGYTRVSIPKISFSSWKTNLLLQIWLRQQFLASIIRVLTTLHKSQTIRWLKKVDTMCTGIPHPGWNFQAIQFHVRHILSLCSFIGGRSLETDSGTRRNERKHGRYSHSFTESCRCRTGRMYGEEIQSSSD